MSEQITVLVVHNEPGAAEQIGEMLEREREPIISLTATTAEAALETWAAADVDCIVSGDELSKMTGLEFLERIREESEEPFVLFPERGSETVASEAIAAGVTHYLEETAGQEQYALLAARIVNAVSRSRTETERRGRERQHEQTLTTLHETTRDLMRAETKREIYRTATEAAVEHLEVQLAAAYAYRPASGVLEHVASVRPTPTVGDPETAVTQNEGVLWDVFSAGEASYYESLSCDTLAAELGPASRSGLVVPLGAHGVFSSVTKPQTASTRRRVRSSGSWRRTPKPRWTGPSANNCFANTIERLPARTRH